MKDYKKWTSKEREKSLRLSNKAKGLGLIPPPIECRFCGKTEGKLQYHNVDYDASLNYLPKMIAGTATAEETAMVLDSYIPVCWRCHMNIHREEKAAENSDRQP